MEDIRNGLDPLSEMLSDPTDEGKSMMQLFDNAIVRTRAREINEELAAIRGPGPELRAWIQKAETFVAEVYAKELFETLINLKEPDNASVTIAANNGR